MKLVGLVLAGFKSFADRTEIKLHKGVTAVVGPNGCGKSNVSDAMRWVMGESRATQLRQESTADIIFNGCSSRAAADWCSVEMRLLNDGSRKLGMWQEYAELSVRRQIDRGGESNYFINGQRVRRRDVVDLFAGTGSGARSYGIVAQEQITNIVQSEPQRLRLLLEDAAGVSVYKERRKETERRLRQSRDNLDRLEDLAGELERQVAALAKQARQTQKVREAKQRLNQARCLELVYRLEELKASSDEAKQQLEQASRHKGTAQKQLAEQEKKLQRMRADRQNLAERQSKLQSSHYAAEAECERVRQQIREEGIVRQQNEQMLADASATIKSHGATAKQLAAELKELQTSGAAADQQRVRGTQMTAAADKRLADCQQQLAAARAAAAELQQELDEAAGLQSEAEAAGELAQQRARDSQERQQAAQRELAGLAPADKFDQQRLEQLAGDADAARKDAQQQAAKIQQVQDELLEVREEYYRAQNQHGRLNAQLQLLQNLASQSEQSHGKWLKENGLPDAKRIAQQGVFKAAGYERALDAALAAFVNGYAIEDFAQLGGRTELPDGMVLVSPEPEHSAAPPRPPRRNMRPLIEQVSCAPRWQAALASWLAGAYVADDHETARAWQQQLGAGETVVTVDGYCYQRSALRAPDSHLPGLEWQSRLEQVAGQIAAGDKTLAALDKKLQDCKMQHDRQVERGAQLAKRREAAQRLLGEAEQEAARCRHAAEFHAQQSKRLLAAAAAAAAEAKLQQQQISKAQQAAVAAQRKCEQARQRQQRGTSRQQQAEAQLDQQRAAHSELAAGLREAELTAAHNEERAKDLQGRLKEQHQLLDDSRRRTEQLQAQLRVAATDRLEPQLKKAEARSHKTRQALAKAEEHAKQAASREVAAEQQLAQLRADVDKQSQECHQLEIDFTSRSSEARALQQQIDQHNVKVAELADLRAKCLDAAQAAQLIARLGRQIEAAGAVNYAADAEHDEAKRRLGEIQAQTDDLNHALESLQAAIRRIDQEMLARLRQVFSTLNLKFDALFKGLFDGGRAALALAGDSLLSAGIVLDVQPPGKRISGVHALSGGEKTLVGLAFLFALNEFNSPPFCVLDEVDAALDEVNTRRFCKLIDSMRDNTQFVIITHNRAVMENVERMIGVTQHHKGISQIVSVSLQSLLDKAPQADAAASMA